MNCQIIDLSTVSNWDDFHDLFIKIFEFPSYYGRNMNAWIDCMEEFSIGDGFLKMNLIGMMTLKKKNRDIYDALNDCAAFINYRSIESGGDFNIALCYGSD